MNSVMRETAEGLKDDNIFIPLKTSGFIQTKRETADAIERAEQALV